MFRGNIKKNGYFPEQHWLIAFVIDTVFALCEVETEIFVCSLWTFQVSGY
jgi:hypothetical protein